MNWKSDLVYGWSCGIGSQMPEEASKVEEFVKFKRLDSIKNWLRSPNPVKQLYAIKAFNMIGHSFLSSKEKELIDMIRKKNVFIPVCYGCIQSKEYLSEVIKEIDSENRTNFSFGRTIFISFLALILLFLIFRRHTK